MQSDVVFLVQNHRPNDLVFVEHFNSFGGSREIVFDVELHSMYVNISPARAKEWIRLLNEAILRAE